MCLSAVLGVGSALIGASSASKAAKSQERSAKDNLALQERIYEETTDRFSPYVQSGLTGQQAYAYELGLGEAPEGYQGYQQSPAYDFLLNRGVQDVESAAASRGSLYSGATATALEKFRMGLASQEQNTFLNRLGGLGSQGQAAAGQQAGAGQNFAMGAGQTYSDIGNAQASRAIGVGNAISGGINQGVGMYGYLRGLEG